MNKSAIMQLYNEERGNYKLIKPTEEYLKFFDEEIKRDKILREKLSKDLLKLYLDVLDATEAKYIEEIETNYKEGFKFGFLLGLEVAEE